MLVAYAPPIFSIKHAVFFTKRCFFRCLFTLVALFSVYSHSQIIRSLPSLLHVHPSVALCLVSPVLLVSLLVLGLLVGCTPFIRDPCTSCSFLHDLFLVLPPSRPHCCSPIPARSFRRCLCLPHCITFFPFTLRRASHSKPPNICYSPSPSFHCKIYTPFHRSFNTHASFSLT